MSVIQIEKRLLLFQDRIGLQQGYKMLASMSNFRYPVGSPALRKCSLLLPTGLKLPFLFEQGQMKKLKFNFCYSLNTQIIIPQLQNTFHSF